MKNHDPLVRPVIDRSQPVNITISISIRNLVMLDIKKQTLQAFGWLRVSWVDEFLTWDPRVYQVSSVRLDPDMLWHPQLVIFNTVKHLDELEIQKVKLTLRHDGKVMWFPGGMLETFCSIDVAQYPMDTQTCDVDVIPWNLVNSFLNGTFDTPAFRIDGMQDHPEWTLLATGTSYTLRATGFWVMTFSFTLQRKVLFHVMQILLPIVLLSLMNCLVFLLPVESGEKMTVSVTVFLSFAVFMSVIAASLPQNSDSVCLFGVFVAVQMLFSVCSIVMAIVTVIVFDTDDQLASGPIESGRDEKSTNTPLAEDLDDLQHTNCNASDAAAACPSDSQELVKAHARSTKGGTLPVKLGRFAQRSDTSEASGFVRTASLA
nr:hypothetical protein BaRGS_025129 [Batillaria attramentaria]